MKLLIALVMFLSTTCFASHSVYQYNGQGTPNVGIGLMFGQPTGLTGKFWLDDKSALDVDFTYSWNHAYNVIVDYLYHPKFNSIVKPYIGIGGEVFLYNGYDWDYHHGHHGHYYVNDMTAAFGIRIPLGFEVLPKDLPMGFFAELAPGLILTHDVYGFLQGSVGARFYFL